jgi:hypothetical protein
LLTQKLPQTPQPKNTPDAHRNNRAALIPRPKIFPLILTHAQTTHSGLPNPDPHSSLSPAMTLPPKKLPLRPAFHCRPTKIPLTETAGDTRSTQSKTISINADRW